MTGKLDRLTPELAAYVREHGAREPDVLARLREEATHHPQGIMQIDAEEGSLLAMLVRLLGAEHVLEIGTFTGYSSTVMALALPPGGRIVCCDVSKEFTDRARKAWAEAGVEDRVELRIGPAVDTLEELENNGSTFDLAFIDANKDEYPDYYEACVRLVRPGGLICVDNVLWSGRVAEADNDEASTRRMRSFNDILVADERVDVAMLSIADGLTLARVR